MFSSQTFEINTKSNPNLKIDRDKTTEKQINASLQGAIQGWTVVVRQIHGRTVLVLAYRRRWLEVVELRGMVHDLRVIYEVGYRVRLCEERLGAHEDCVGEIRIHGIGIRHWIKAILKLLIVQVEQWW